MTAISPTTPTPQRHALPQRRYSETFDVCFPRGTNKAYSVTLGCYADGHIGEVFLTSHKGAGSQADLAARDTAILISMGLQLGASLSELAHAMTHDAAGQPEGLAGVVLERLLQWQCDFLGG